MEGLPVGVRTFTRLALHEGVPALTLSLPDSFFFLMSTMLLAIVLVLIFFKDPLKNPTKDEDGSAQVEKRSPAAVVA